LQLFPWCYYVSNKLYYTKTRSILDIFIKFFLHLFITNIFVTKLKVLSPLVFQIVSNYANVCACANFLQYFTITTTYHGPSHYAFHSFSSGLNQFHYNDVIMTSCPT
jgi:hypothetical protein